MMPDLEKVIKGLQIERECVFRDCDRDCGKCDLVQDKDWLLSVYDDAIALLEEQEARLMTKEEIINWDGYIWKEYKDISTMNVSEIKHEIEFVPYEGQFNTKNFTWNTYCRLWRCWSNKPTDKQRKKVKWDE